MDVIAADLLFPRRCARALERRSPAQWARETYAHAHLPDSRLKSRLIRIAETLASAPGDSLPQACANLAETKGAYRFIENDRLGPEIVARPLYESTAKRCAGEEMILAVQDTTFLTFPAAFQAEGLGKINNLPSQAIALHSTIALRPDGVALGIAHLHSWCRTEKKGRANRPIEEKESFRWLEAMRSVHETFARSLPEHERPRLCHVCDREGDIHELFVLADDLKDALVVRSAQNRRVETEGRIAKARQSVERSRRRGTVTIAIARRPGRAARKATLEIRFQAQTLSPSNCAPPQRRRGKVGLWLVEARETDPPEGQQPLCWRLWTNEKVESLDDAVRIVGIYRRRWLIEEYHRVLKEGCKMEAVRFHTAARIRLVLALYAAVALRILEMRALGQCYPDQSCLTFLSDQEWRILWIMREKRAPEPDQKPPTVAQAVKWIGALGGHLGRKGDGMPGTKTLWRGFRDLQLLAQYEEAREMLAREMLARENPP